MITTYESLHTMNDNIYDVIYDSERKAFGVIVAWDDFTCEPQIKYCDSLDNAKRLAIGFVIAENNIFNF